MKLLLTTSRNASQRVRQFIKEFSHIFPKSNVQKANRGKKSLQDLFNESIDKYDRILLITNKQGNPNKIIGYYKNQDKEFIWGFEFKLKYVKLSYEFDSEPLRHPKNLNLLFEEVDHELEKALSNFFDPFLVKSTNDMAEETLNVLFRHNEKGFELFPLGSADERLAPEIAIREIIIEDSEVA